MAAATAAALGAKLGVAGTVIGAAFTSLIINVGGKLYGETLQRTKHGVSGVLSRQNRSGSQTVGKTDEPKAGGRHEVTQTTKAVSGRDASDGANPARLMSPKGPGGRRRWTIIAISTLASFALAAVVVTMVEAATGRGLDGSETTTIGRVTGQDAPKQKKSGGDDPSIAPTQKGQQRSDDEEKTQPSSQPSQPGQPDETRPDSQPSGNPAPDAQPEPEEAPAAPADPPAAQPKAQNQQPDTSE